MAKKKKAAPAEAAAQQDDAAEQPSTSGRGRLYTVSMAVPGSMIDNTQNIEFATFVAGQVRIALLVWRVTSASNQFQIGRQLRSNMHTLKLQAVLLRKSCSSAIKGQ